MGGTRGTVRERFWWGVRTPDGPEGCWQLRSHRGPGYASISPGPGIPNVTAHRASYELNLGPVPSGLFVLHTCDRKWCVNPAHLYAGTALQNTADARERGLLRQCERHPNSRLTNDAVREIRASSEPLAVLSARYGASRATICRARSGATWKTLGLLALAFLWTQAAFAAPCRDAVTGAFIKCPETFVMDAGLGVVASLSSEASAGEPTAELAVGFDLADANKSPRLDLVARFGALPGATVDLADPTTFRSMGLEGYLSQPLSPVLRLKPAALIGLEFRFSGETEPLHRAARFGYLGVRFDSKAGYLFLGAGGDERLSTHERSTPQYLPSATVAWRVRLANLTGKVDAYLTGRVLLFLRLGYQQSSAGSDVAQIGVLIGGGKR